MIMGNAERSRGESQLSTIQDRIYLCGRFNQYWRPFSPAKSNMVDDRMTTFNILMNIFLMKCLEKFQKKTILQHVDLITRFLCYF